MALDADPSTTCVLSRGNPAILALAVSFGLHISGEQVGALTAVTAAVLAFVTQTQVTPIVNPRDNAGNQLVPAETKPQTSSTRAAA